MSNPPDPWYFWNDGAQDAAVNMARDDALLQTAAATGRAVLRFYRWTAPSVTIGLVQSYPDDLAAAGWRIVRRPTGGGVVFHDDGEFTYSLAFPPGHWVTELDRMASYNWIHHAIAYGLSLVDVETELTEQDIPAHVDRASMRCFENPTRYDIISQGRKIGGSAQRRTPAGLLHQGSLRVADVSRDALAETLLTGFTDIMNVALSDYIPTDAFFALAAELAASRYSTREWNENRMGGSERNS